jgi:hypothetical protein
VKRTHFRQGLSPFDRGTGFGAGIARTGQNTAMNARLTHAKPIQGEPWRMKTSQATDIGATIATILIQRFDTKLVMEASAPAKELLW